MTDTVKPDWAINEDGSQGNTMVPKLDMAQEHLATLASERYEKILTLEREKADFSGQVSVLEARVKDLEAMVFAHDKRHAETVADLQREIELLKASK